MARIRRVTGVGYGGWLLGAISVAGSVLGTSLHAQEGGERFREPVFRTAGPADSLTTAESAATRPASPANSLGGTAGTSAATAPHVLDPALEMAYSGLRNIRERVRDYSCTLVKREQIKGKLGDYEYMYLKVRNRKVSSGRELSPFSVYMYFLKPSSVKGREVIFVEGQNNNKLCAHEGGTGGRWLPMVWLDPEGVLAMRGQRYPVTEVGIENLIVKLIEKGQRDRQRGECHVEFRKNANVNGRNCTVIQVTHPVPRPHFDFHVARIFIDDELNVPIRYSAWDWPTQAGGKPTLLEEYTYLNLKLNVGLTDADFDHRNANYSFVSTGNRRTSRDTR